MDLARLVELIELAARANLRELELTQDDIRVRITRSVASERVPAATAVFQRVQVATTAQSSERLVVAPMFGVVHLTPSPDAAPYVRVGDTVEAGQTLCLIEAMKTFMPVHATGSGMIAAILVERGAEVDVGRPLFRIE